MKGKKICFTVFSGGHYEQLSLKNNLHPMKKKKGHSQASHGEMA